MCNIGETGNILGFFASAAREISSPAPLRSRSFLVISLHHIFSPGSFYDVLFTDFRHVRSFFRYGRFSRLRRIAVYAGRIETNGIFYAGDRRLDDCVSVAR